MPLVTMPNDGSLPTPPETFICPLTLDVMRQPVMTKYGHSFERTALIHWMKQNDTCPMTRQPLRPRFVVSNRALQSHIDAWKSRHGIQDDNDDGIFATEIDESLSFSSSQDQTTVSEIFQVPTRTQSKVQQALRFVAAARRCRDNHRFSRGPVSA